MYANIHGHLRELSGPRLAVEFGRKGVLGVGSRLGGLMPGWVSGLVYEVSCTIADRFNSGSLSSLLRARSAIQCSPRRMASAYREFPQEEDPC